MTHEGRLFWEELRRHTHARIGLGRAGAAMPTGALLELQLAAANARDAIYKAFDPDAIERQLAPLACLGVSSMAPDRTAYLKRPDLGRRLAPASVELLADYAAHGGWDVVFVAADGLSATAAETYAAAVVTACIAQLPDWKIAPIILARLARVALADEIGQIMGARSAMILLGERPGLSAADSLGLYLTWSPRVGVHDSRRNCISNVHAAGLPPHNAGCTAAWLLREARRRRLSGIELKEDAAAAALSSTKKSVSIAEGADLRQNEAHD